MRDGFSEMTFTRIRPLFDMSYSGASDACGQKRVPSDLIVINLNSGWNDCLTGFTELSRHLLGDDN